MIGLYLFDKFKSKNYLYSTKISPACFNLKSQKLLILGRFCVNWRENERRFLPQEGVASNKMGQ